MTDQDQDLDRLITLLEGGESVAVQQSLAALGHSRRVEAVPAIVAFIERGAHSDSPAVLVAAVEALQRLMAVVLGRTGAVRPIYHEGTGHETYLSRPQEELVWAVTASFGKLRADPRPEVSGAANTAARSTIKLLRVWFPSET